MSWTLLACVIVVVGTALAIQIARRHELDRMVRAKREHETARRHGAAEAQLQHPVIDLSRCMGCATCVAVCPEDGVLDLVHGQAMVVNGARCMGVGACERECPVDAITVTLANVTTRDDLPAITDDLEAIGEPGLFLAGEVTAHALIKTAIEHGAAVAREVARRCSEPDGSGVLDLCIVGAGPAGIACALEAQRLGLHAVTIEQEESVGGTVAKYPRRKLVLTEPVELPTHGRLSRREFEKEELVELWQRIVAERELPVRTGEAFEGLERDAHDHLVVQTDQGYYVARNVCLAIGRRGVPNRLGVPGEDLPKVGYGLLDARSYEGRRVLVVGGGDAAIETALALAEQNGNDVTLAYRQQEFFRARGRNVDRLAVAENQGRIRVALRTEVVAIAERTVDLRVDDPASYRRLTGVEPVPADTADVAVAVGAPPIVELDNDHVFVMVGGTAPTELLAASGVSFDAELREAPEPIVEQGTGLVRALTVALALSLAALAWALWHADYYLLSPTERPAHESHPLLRPSRGIGLWFGILAVACVLLNLAYLLRRSRRLGARFGSLRAWMTSHVATGVLAVLLALLHGAMAPGDTAGGQAFWALAVLLLTGAIGRYFYAWVPRAANGRELELEEVKRELDVDLGAWPDDGGFAARSRTAVRQVVERRQWRSSFLGRLVALLGLRGDLRRLARSLREDGARAGVEPARIATAIGLAERAYRAAIVVAHYEDLRALLASWRWLHRWVAALMVLLLVVHIVHALVYGDWFGGGP